MKFLFFLLITTAFTDFSHARVSSPQKNTCGFYTDLEQAIPCGPDGYALDFGKKYCYKFLKSVHHKFSSQGQNFLKKNAFCLQRIIFKAYQQNSKLSCGDIREKSFAGHSSCFIDSGFCELSAKDKLILTNEIKSELFVKEIIEQMPAILEGCKNKEARNKRAPTFKVR